MLLAGVDEVGRGPLAGPVLAAAVILPACHGIVGLADSKKLSEKKRNELYALIYEQSLAVAVGEASVAEIDSLNILQASLLAMSRAVAALRITPDHVWVDGLHLPKIAMPATAFVRGDQTHAIISAASIMAKVTRDRQMVAYDHLYPGYGLAQHKGYPTRQHREALQRLGATPIHRQSFQGVCHVSKTSVQSERSRS